MGIIGWLRGRDRAQVLLLTALMVPILLGMTAIAVDVGSYADDKRNLQNAADAIALASAKDLCTPDPHVCTDTTAAQATANSYATKNGIDPAEMTVQFLGGSTAPKVRVTLAHGHAFAFMPVLGVGSKGVSVVAAAVRTSPGGASGIVPFSVTQTALDAAIAADSSVTLHFDAGGGTTGNYGIIDVDGNGAAVYGTDLKFGSPSMVCSVTQPACVQATCQSGGAFPSACAEDAPSCDGPVCTSETGVKKGPTQDGVDLRTEHTSAACDTFDEAFSTTSITGKYALNPDCNPWGAGACPVPDDGTTLCSRRVIIVPIIDGFTKSGKADFTIQSFALMFLDGTDCPTGNDCEITGRFVKADVAISGLAGTYDPDSSIHMEKLVE